MNEYRHTGINIPILDDIINVREVDDQVRRLKAEKECSPDGVSPGLKVLPPHWTVTIIALFKGIFMTGCYPRSCR